MKNLKTYEDFEPIESGITFKKYLYKHTLPNRNDLGIDCENSGLIDLNGIDIFKNIISLNCSVNLLESLKGIENLTKLEYLECYANNLTSLKIIENLNNLSFLNCNKNKLSSLEGIENLTKLKTFAIHKNEISTLKPLENLTKLELLYCEDNPIDWVDYIDKKGNKWYTVLPKSIKYLFSDKFHSIDKYWEFIDKNQPIAVSRKFNF